MIVTKVRLDPFGGLSGRELEFHPGLNVIEGANEAGKSTIFWAIQKALFTPVNLNKRVFEREIKRFLPIGGGDTVHVEVHFSHKGQTYKLQRTWGATKSAELKMSDGSVLTDDLAISEQLGEFLPASEGTFKSVLMTYQSGLEMTLDDLKEYPDTVHTLGDLLRKVVMETDGISVDGFKSRIQSQYDEYFSRWDKDRNYPEAGRGINNPWKREVGFILDVFYEKEKTRVALENAHRYEEELDKLNQLIAEAAKKVSEKEEYVKSNKKAVEDARERRTLSAELRAIENSIEEIKKINSKWPVLESQVEAIRKVIPELEEKEKELAREKSLAELMEKNKALVEKFRRVDEKKKAFDKAEGELKNVKKLTIDDLDEISSVTNELNRLKAGLDAGKLVVDFRAKQGISLSVQKDLEDETREELKAKESFQLEAGGRIRIEHPDWLMEATSGEGNFEEIRKNYKEAERALAALLKKHGVESLEKATQINRKYEKYIREVERARKNYKEELGDDSYESLELKVKGLGQIKETRPPATIATELANVQSDLKFKSRENEEKQETLNGFSSKYESKDKLILKLAEEMGKEKEIQGKIEGLAPLPEGIEDAEKYIIDYEEKQEGLEADKESKNKLEIKRAELDGPGESSEELERQLKDEEESFTAVLKKGEAIARIKDITEKILEDMDIGTYEELEKDLEKYVAVITEDRYSAAKMEEGLPQGFVRADGEVVFYEFFSQGTKDVLGLALRLSMANHFLIDTEGFVAMDDPLVNLDPARQRQAAEIIKVYGENKQVLIFTCHPANAELLGGNKITL
jgi:exonuclease SbcC